QLATINATTTNDEPTLHMGFQGPVHASRGSPDTSRALSSPKRPGTNNKPVIKPTRFNRAVDHTFLTAAAKRTNGMKPLASNAIARTAGMRRLASSPDEM